MKFIKTKIPDCYEIRPNLLKDERGIFVKTFFMNLFFKRKRTRTNFIRTILFIIK
ncbi:dTDP-4-dehydrorhamnose 3,5-epimerase family protein [Anaerobacillus sp. HL2]|nr:dTDP-4-dehydrorhamnose 3,5-epimerase family protein [Anaerobacillus sp. HL2]